ncbi:alkylation response protein AidB-like acyl-CoA dehydrogenase [Actinoplanes octamycinicus]|uniref:Alkylation response protein AidB-like acyl-CoA dehydrogenase n=1 Tax=Actinoplanes octamycinicus TaxID=135948 RepID=A0A7W7H746_9ACTN|nr:acyl-CoA dehydrogenase family protein [Actinoplanes octamycinicus]MBB4745250.1 alkylation response protein AidB-like acyl-CoA dehydrogenase [Actinoplanes octamycinicus]GIE62272.1 acyl-CoA dehydrogenase [Actinoplanes octamycinicus]
MGPDFALDDTQEAIVRLAGEVLGDHDGSPRGLWKSLGQAGLLGLAVPVECGGAGLGAVATGLLLTEIGRHAAGVPAWSTLSLGVLPVVRWGSPGQQRDLLPAVLDGRVLTAALAGQITAGRGGRLTGTCRDVPDADQAYRVLVQAGETVALVDPAAPGVTIRPTPGGFALRLRDVAAEPLGDGKGDLHRYAVAGACALGDGALAGALRMTAGHVRDRHQFGRPLATFQAVAQQIADVYIAARTMHLAALAASWSAAKDDGDDADLWTAAYWLCSEALPALRTCHHLHGGLGLAADYPLHRHTALVRDLVRHLGGAEHCLDRLGADDVHRAD